MFEEMVVDVANARCGVSLSVWCEFLGSRDSLYVLNDSPTGWKSAAAQKSTKIELFQYDPNDKYWGFSSWNDFFTRKFKEDARPVADGRWSRASPPNQQDFCISL